MQTTAATPSPRLHTKTRSSLHPMVKPFPWLWLLHFQCQPVTWSDQGQNTCLAWAGAHGEVTAGNLAATRTELSLPCLTRGAQASHNPSVSSPPTCQGGLSPLCRIPGLGHQICGWNHSLPREGLHPCNLPFAPSPLPGTQVPN